MRITLLGTGDSAGTPVIGCRCGTCQDAKKKGWERTRFSVMVQNEGKTLLIDTSPDMRKQLLDCGVERVDAVIWTYCHFDHFGGFGNFYRVQKNVKVYTTPCIHDDIERFMRFMDYKPIEVECYEPFELIGFKVTLFEVNHPPVNAVGIKIEWNGYGIVISGDTNSEIPRRSLDEILNPDLFIVEALSPWGKFRKHMNADEALSLSKRIGARRVVLTHLGHFFPPPDVAKRYYPIGYDYQTFEFK
jgi:phosphoribosyl 1,2-cyclic phosphate phosphodiesterase